MTVSRGRTAIDLGFELTMQTEFCPKGVPSPAWWLWSDSSPMGGNNWLVSMVHYALCKTERDWIALAESFHELCRRNQQMLTHDRGDDEGEAGSDTSLSEGEGFSERVVVDNRSLHVDDGEVDFDDDEFGDDADMPAPKPLSDRSLGELSRVMCGNLSYHHLLPQACGTRAASLPHKVSGIASALTYPCGDAMGLDGFLKTGVSGTFDLGTEYGVPDIPHAKFWTHFADHTQPSHMHADDSEQHADFAADEPEVRPYLFERMLSIAGILHIIDTVTKQLHTGIKDWDTFTAHLLSIVALLCYEGPDRLSFGVASSAAATMIMSSILIRRLMPPRITDGPL